MKDEDLDNMDILEDDYEVLRLTKLIKKSKSALKKIPIKIWSIRHDLFKLISLDVWNVIVLCLLMLAHANQLLYA